MISIGKGLNRKFFKVMRPSKSAVRAPRVIVFDFEWKLITRFYHGRRNFWMVGIDIKRFVKHLKLSVQVKKFLGRLTYGTRGGKYKYCDWKWLV